MSKNKKIPNFKNEGQERKFWESNDSSDYIDWSKADSVTLVNLKPSTKTISLRLPEFLLENIKIEANKRDQSVKRSVASTAITQEVRKLKRFSKLIHGQAR